jgi:hypothetical protein
MYDVTRSGFFGRIIAIISGFIALCFTITILGYAILPAFRKEEESWTEVGPLDNVRVN